MRKQAIQKIQKRNGSVVDFNKKKIENAILKCLNAVGNPDKDMARDLTKKVVNKLRDKWHYQSSLYPTVEAVQDVVEQVLLEEQPEVARAYVSYRQMRANIRQARQLIGVPLDDIKVSVNAAEVLRQRYLLEDNDGNVETPSQMFRRVARSVASADLLYDEHADLQKIEDEFYELMANFKAMPNSPTLFNSGTSLGALSACYLLPVEDSIEAIFTAVKNFAIISKTGGGVGLVLSHLRSKNSRVRSTNGVASGPVSWMQVFNAACGAIKQGSRRRGALMGVLRYNHPDILEFVTCKQREGELSNFNISVTVTNEFMDKVVADEHIDLIDPHSGEVTQSISARYLFDLIVVNAWATGDPGMIFLDRINKDNPTPKLGEIEGVNVCGEVPLLPFESCNLMSINLHKVAHNGKIDWNQLKKTVRLVVHFLDNVIDVNKYPLPEIDYMAKANRKIGLGIMGWANILFELNIPYNSDEAIELAGQVMRFIYTQAIIKSAELAEERGSFPNFEGSTWEMNGFKMMRNACLTTGMPAGTVSIIADTSSGIEPVFAFAYSRNVAESLGTVLFETNPIFESVARERGFYSPEMMVEVGKRGSIQRIEGIPEDVKKVFVTALDIDPIWHVKMQAAFQNNGVDLAVSKTVNLPQNATLEDVKQIYLMAYKMGCKGITIYRYGSKNKQVLNIEKD